MIRISEIAMPLDTTEADLRHEAARRLGVGTERIKTLRVARKSVDARKKQAVHFVYTLLAELEEKEETAILKRRGGPRLSADRPFSYAVPRKKSGRRRLPLSSGLARRGCLRRCCLHRPVLCPIVLERGRTVEEREAAVRAFQAGGPFSETKNIPFGEGGAGTFSDGKLTTGTHDPAPERCYWSLRRPARRRKSFMRGKTAYRDGSASRCGEEYSP